MLGFHYDVRQLGGRDGQMRKAVITVDDEPDFESSHGTDEVPSLPIVDRIVNGVPLSVRIHDRTWQYVLGRNKTWRWAI